MRTNPFSPIYKRLNAGVTENTSVEMPLKIDIELTNACNFNCLFCHTGTKAQKRPVGFMTKELYCKIIDEIAPYKVPLRFVMWGEPMLHKKFFYFLETAKDKGLMCHLTTNGSFLNKDTIVKLLDLKLDSLKYSFQGTDEKTYGEMRYGQSFGKLADTVKLFHELRGNLSYPYLHVATTITYETPEMTQKFKDYLGSYCDLITVGHTRLYHISPEQTSLSEEAKKKLDELKLQESLKRVYKYCNEVYDSFTINWDGKVSACCQDYDNIMIVGDLSCSSISDVWKNSEKLKLYRSMLKECRHDELPLCKECYDFANIRMTLPLPNKHR